MTLPNVDELVRLIQQDQYEDLEFGTGELSFSLEEVIRYIDKAQAWEGFLFSGTPKNWPTWTLMKTPKGYVLFERFERDSSYSETTHSSLRDAVIDKICRIVKGCGYEFRK